MPYTLDVLPEERLMRLRLWGPISLDTLHEVALAAWEHPEYDPSFAGLYDIRGTEITLTARDVFNLRARLKTDARYHQGDHAIVVTTPVLTAFSMLYAAWSKPQRVRVFSSPDAAHTWLQRHSQFRTSS